jgi:hypothetical protein
MVFPDLFHIPEPVGRGKRLAVQRAGDGAQLQPAHLVFLQRFIATQDIVQLPVFAVHMDSLYGASIIRDFNIVVCAVGDTEQGHLCPRDCPEAGRDNFMFHWCAHFFASLLVYRTPDAEVNKHIPCQLSDLWSKKVGMKCAYIMGKGAAESACQPCGGRPAGKISCLPAATMKTERMRNYGENHVRELQ